MLFKWFREHRQRAIQANIEHLTRQLTEREPKDWRAIDQEIIKWPKAGKMWADEIRILKKLGKYGPLAKNSVMAIAQSAEQSLWGHCIKVSGGKKQAGSIFAYGLLFDGHKDVHLKSLLYSLQALNAIGTDEPAVVHLFKEVIEESKPPTQSSLEAARRGAEKARYLGAILEIPDDVPYRSSIRAFALVALGKSAKIMLAEGKTFADCAESIVDALNDPKSSVRTAAVGTLANLEPSLSKARLSQIAPHVLSVVRTPEFAQEFSQHEAMVDRLTTRWESYRQPSNDLILPW